MLIIHIGLIGNIGKELIDSLPLPKQCEIRIFSSIQYNFDNYECVIVGQGAQGIDLCGAKAEEIDEYIVAVSDIVISENYNYVCDRARARKGIPYIFNDKVKLGLRSIEMNDDRLLEYFTQIFSEIKDNDSNANPFWKNAYSRFFKKFKRKNNSETYNENINKTSKMYSMFEEYDSKANKYNSIYRSSLYLRALFPLLATLTLALAQNTKTFGEFIFGGKYWGLAAAVLFIVQAVFNYIIIALSNYIVNRYVIENFVHYRYLAESLRMTMILAPNSLPIQQTDRIVFTDTENRLNALNNRAKQIYRENYATANIFTNEKCLNINNQLKAMARNQLGYHKCNALNCERAEKYLTNSARVIFVCGLIAVLGRSVYQLIMQFVNMGNMVNGVTVGAFFLAVMNFMALLIPAFTTMFMDLKKGLNISNNRARSQVMDKLLTEFLDAVENTGEPIYSEIYPAVCKLTDILIQEALDWNTTTEQHKVSKM